MRKILTSFLALMVTVTLFAAPRTVEEAAEIAAQFTNSQPQLSRMHKAPRKAANMRLAHKAMQLKDDKAAFYVFNQDDNNGFVIVSADDCTNEDVLGYTENGSFNINTINPNLRFWLSRYEEEISFAANDPQVAKAPRKAAKTVTAIPNLLVNKNGKEITWYQEAPYSNLCPMDNYDNTRCLTGCVATAASQIMYKWAYPTQGTGTKTYTWNNPNKSSQKVTMTVKYGETTYDWANMLPAYGGKSYTDEQATAVATLMYHAGVAAEMGYGGDAAGGSGAWTDDMAYGLKTYFGYEFDKFITMYSKSGYQSAKRASVANVTAEFNVTRDQFTSYFNADLEAGRPIMMGGEDSDGGHEFVCCGRDANNKFYINWGWEGDGNGHYAITALKPSGTSYNFSSNLDALIGLRPAKEYADVTVTWNVDGETTQTTAVKGVLVFPTAPTCESDKVFVGWTATAGYESETTAPTFVKNGAQLEEDATYYAVFADKEEPQGEAAFDGVNGGSFKIYADVNGTAYYATSVSNNKLQSTTDESKATTFTFTATTNGFTISNGTNYIAHGSGTNLSASDSEYEWTVEAGEQGTWRVNSQTSGRALVFRGGSYNVFGGYATSNLENANNTEYFDLEIGGKATVKYSNYSTSCGAAIECTLKSISVSGAKSVFKVNEAFATTGLVVKAQFEEGECKEKTVQPTSVSTPDMTTAGKKTVTVTYALGEVTKTATYEIQVNPLDVFTVRFYNNGQILTTKEVTEGQEVELPAAAACDETYSFVGWWTAELAADNTSAKDWITADFVPTDNIDLYAIYSLTEEGEGEAAFDGQTPGNYKIFVPVGEDNYYLTGTLNDANKLESTKDESKATTFTVEKTQYYFAIKNGNKYIAYSGSSTNLSEDDEAYDWTITKNDNAWRIASAISDTRAIALRINSNYQSFGAYSTTNINNSEYYFDLHIGGGASSTTYYTSMPNCTPTVAITNTAEEVKAAKFIRNGQLFIQIGEAVYTITGERVR